MIEPATDWSKSKESVLRRALPAFAFLFLVSLSALAANPKIDALFAEVDRRDSPGYSVAVIRDGKIVHARGYGMADLERNVKLSSTSVLDIGSTSKQFTAAAILLLEQEGKLSLTDDIRKFLPEMPQYERRVTIGHLINHTSGVRDYLTLMALAGRDYANDYSDEETLGWIARQNALNFLPGDDHLYSNSGYYLLSQIVERASGKTLRNYADAKIFKPLGMSNTHFHDDPTEIVKNRAIGYDQNGDGYIISMSNYHVTGDGALYTTVEDLAKWDANFYAPKVGGQPLLDAMHRVARLTTGKELTYAAGLMLTRRHGVRVVEHGGAWMGYRAQMSRYPDQKLTVIVLSNFAGGDVDGMGQKIAALYLDAPGRKSPTAPATATTPSIALSAAQLATYPKTYFHPRVSGYRRIEVKDGKLWYLVPGGRARALRPIGADRFELAGGPAKTILTVTATGATIDIEGEEPVLLTAAVMVTPDHAALAQYAGTYRSEELEANHRIHLRDGALYVRAGHGDEQELSPRERDVFDADGILLRFTRGQEGAITGYSVSAGRVRGIAFVRR